MKTKLFVPILALSIVALACGAIPDISSLTNPLPHDDFSSSSSGWGTGTDSQSSVEYANGGLQFIVFQPVYITWSTPDLTSYDNVHIEVNVKNGSIDPKAMFGIICNEQGKTNSFYYIGVSSGGYYGFIKSAVAQDDVYLKEGTSDLIPSDATSMKIGLDCAPNNLTLYVNDQKIDSINDSSYGSGVLGVFAASGDQSSGTNVLFDDFVVTKLSQ